ncbi:MAG: hypothetical protein H6515_14700 [Microthrixaceae bacterium]|jgi:hypothetical protein|nr:hypothetical protein [Microthrixaceae bacterium]
MPPGRKPRLAIDPDLKDRIVQMVRVGMYPERAAVAAGVGERTHYLWQAKGLEEREHREDGKKPRVTMQVYLDYVDALDRAVAEAEFLLLGEAQSGTPAAKDHLAILERRFRDRWSPKVPPAAKGAATGPAPKRTGLDMLAERRNGRVKKTS